ncbi:MAG: methyl-accepting chemotaxis protein [Pseudomonadota bacterium]|nr:methyl-accepting chemotaxis protein [Pseudomonadota bacterium]
MEPIAQTITQPWMVTVFVSTILLVALRPLYQAIFSISAVNRDVSEAIGVLTHLGKNRQDEFYNQFKTVNGLILRIPGLRHTWREFVDSMYFEDPNIPNIHKKAYVSHRPSHYFNRDAVLGTRLNLPQFFAYPNYLIGIGLTFTFIGLAAALHVAQAGLANGAGQQALKDLLAVAALKFISSIVGISSSLFISAVQRIRIRTFQQKLNTFCDLLEECTKYKSAEKLLHDSFNEQRRHTIVFHDLARNIADGIREAISAELAAGVAHGLEPLTQNIQALAQQFAEGSEAALGRMLEAFLSELRRTSLDDMQALMNSAAALKESLGQLVAQVEFSGRNFDAGAQAFAQRLDDMFRNFAASFAPVQASMTQFDQSLHALHAVTDNIARTAADHQQGALAFEQAIAELTPHLCLMKDLPSGLAQSLNEAEGAARNLREAGENIAAAAGEFRESAAAIKRSEETFKKNVKAFASFARGISGVIALLERASGQVSSAAISLHSLDRQFGRSVDSLNDAVRQLPAAGQEKNGHSLFRLTPKWWRP